MIDQALAYMRRDLRDGLALADDEVMLEGAGSFSDRGRSPGVRLTLVNVEQAEAGLEPPPARPQAGGNRQPAPLALHVYLLVAFEFESYETSLRQLSATLDLLHAVPLRTAATAGADNPFPAGLERLSVELHSMNFDSLHRLWALLGRTYAPSVVCRLGLRRAVAGEGGR